MKPSPSAAAGADTGPEPSLSPGMKLWVVLARAHQAIETRLQASLAEHELTLTEFGILEVLLHRGPMLLGEVQRRILVSSGGVTYLVDRLERKGLVERRDCPEDRRARYAALTPQGERVIGVVFPQHVALIEELTGVLSEEERREAARLIRRLGRSAAGLDAGEAP